MHKVSTYTTPQNTPKKTELNQPAKLTLAKPCAKLVKLIHQPPGHQGSNDRISSRCQHIFSRLRTIVGFAKYFEKKLDEGQCDEVCATLQN